MQYYVYILESESSPEKHYTGMSYDVQQRLAYHNAPDNKGWSRRYQPWRLIYTEVFDTKKEALAREKYLKTGYGREWLKRHVYKAEPSG